MSKRSLLLLVFILGKFILQYLLINPEYDLHRDEYLHLDQASHLAWGYLSVPPFTSWISYLIKLLGNTFFWIKFFPALFGALTLWTVWKIIEELKGELPALLLGATCVLFSALLRMNILYQPNSFDILSWTLLFYVIIRYLNTEKSKWLYIGAVILAVGLLNKYNIAFQVIAFAPALLLTRARNIFLKKDLYLAGILALILFSPNLYWQYTQGFPVFHHLNQLTKYQLVHVNRFDFLKNQLIFFTGSLPVILCGLYALIFYKPFEKYKAFSWSFVFTLALYTYLRAKDYYAVGLYPVYIAFGAVYLQHLSQARANKILMTAATLLPILLFIPLYQVAFPNKSPEQIMQHPERYRQLGLLRWEDGKEHHLPQDFADMLGWEELAKKVDSVYAILPEPETTLVLCDNYGQAGAINYYTKKGIRAVSFNADYIDWIDLDTQYTHAIRVKEREERNQELKEVTPYFERVIIADSISNTMAREYGTVIFIFEGARVNVNELLKAEINEVKSRRK